MARLVNTVATSDILCDIVTTYENGSSTTRTVKTGDVIEDVPIRYVSNKEVKKAIGHIDSVSTVYKKITPIDMKNPVDNFANDFALKDLRIDCSEKFHSQFVTVDCKEIVEDEGVLNVAQVKQYPRPNILLTLTYTDGSTVEQNVEVGDVLEYVKIKTNPGKPDIEGSFEVAALGYTRNGNRPRFDSLILKPYERQGKVVRAYFENIISFEEVPSVEVTDTESLADIATILNQNDKAQASLGVDVTIPPREDGRITTVMINAGKELDLDLSGHTINCEAYAFYVNGGTLNIYDDGNKGKIETRRHNAAYPAIFVASDGECNMYGGTIDTTPGDSEEDNNWIYGVVCSGNGVFNMLGGKMIISEAAGISITNGTAAGEGAQFTIAGDSEITSLGCASIYLADNKSVVVKDNAMLNSGIVARMGDITIQDNAIVNGFTDAEKANTLGSQVTFSGVDTPKAGILALTGVYNSALGNDMNIVIKDNAKIIGNIDDAIDIATINTKYDQVVNVNVESLNNLKFKLPGTAYRVYSHDELAILAQEAGRPLGPETNSTTYTITIGDEVVSTNVVEENEEEENNG